MIKSQKCENPMEPCGLQDSFKQVTEENRVLRIALTEIKNAGPFFRGPTFMTTLERVQLLAEEVLDRYLTENAPTTEGNK
jgi:hypothetical protein